MRPSDFFKHVDKNGPSVRDLGPCWLWTAAAFKRTGYGQVRLGAMRRAHRAAWFLTHGDIPAGLFVLHTCDVRLCVNPAHLYLGSHVENMADRSKRGRAATGAAHGSKTHPERVACGDRHGFRVHPEAAPRGERNGGGGKLREADVGVIRDALAAGEPKRAIARRFGVSDTLIRYIATGRAWRGFAPRDQGATNPP